MSPKLPPENVTLCDDFLASSNDFRPMQHINELVDCMRVTQMMKMAGKKDADMALVEVGIE